MSDVNPAVQFLDELRKVMETHTISHRKSVLLLTDPRVPPRKVAAFVKTQLTQFIKEWEGANESGE